MPHPLNDDCSRRFIRLEQTQSEILPLMGRVAASFVSIKESLGEIKQDVKDVSTKQNGMAVQLTSLTGAVKVLDDERLLLQQAKIERKRLIKRIVAGVTTTVIGALAIYFLNLK